MNNDGKGFKNIRSTAPEKAGQRKLSVKIRGRVVTEGFLFVYQNLSFTSLDRILIHRTGHKEAGLYVRGRIGTFEGSDYCSVHKVVTTDHFSVITVHFGQ